MHANDEWPAEESRVDPISFNLRAVRCTGSVDFTTSLDGCRELLKGRHRRLPVDASVSDADTLLETRRALGWDLLVAFVDVGLDHDANDGLFALANLLSDHSGHLGLVAMVLVRVSCSLVSAKECKERGRQTYRANSRP